MRTNLDGAIGFFIAVPLGLLLWGCVAAPIALLLWGGDYLIAALN